MFTCKDCVHYNVCGYHIDEETFMTTEECSHFKNKADFVEVKHGKYIELDLGIYECSVCKNRICGFEENIKKVNFCDNCGAKMDGERKCDK